MSASEQMVTCPYCQEQFPLSEAFSKQLKEEMDKDIEERVKAKEADLKKQTDALAAKEKEMADQQKCLQEEFATKLVAERKAAAEVAEQKAKDALGLQLNDLKEQIKERDEKVEEFGRQELELRKKQRELEEKTKNAELEMNRKLDEERARIQTEAQRKADDDYKQKNSENEKVINDLKNQIGEMKRKAEQGSMQTQGEVVELELEEILKSTFPLDEISPVGKGVSGADVIQNVRNRTGQSCGSIIWESKQTKAWTEGWVAKLKDDQRAAKADIAIIMTHVLPKEVTTFGPYNGIWVTDYPSAIGLALALRAGLEEVSLTKLSAVGKNEKMEAIYDYMAGTEFKQKIEAIVE